MKIRFEMGKVDVRNGSFDHHGEISHSQAFIAKMSSVQLIEWSVMTGEKVEEIEFNHHGHIDDLIALAFLMRQNDIHYVQALYRFACEVSVLDSCGPAGYKLVSKKSQKMIDACLGKYHSLCNYDSTLEKKHVAMEEAALILVNMLECEEPAEIKYEELPEDAIIYYRGKVACFIYDGNPFKYANTLYRDGADVIIASNGKGKYSIMAKSNYTTNLSDLWVKLSELEKEGTWGGHAGAGGSPRGIESSLEIGEVLNVLQNN